MGEEEEEDQSCINSDMRAIGMTVLDEVHDRTGRRRIGSATAIPQLRGSG